MLGKQIFFSMLRLIFSPLDPDPKHRLNNELWVEFKMKFTKSAFWKKQEPNILFCFVFRIANTESTTDIAAFSRNLNDTNMDLRTNRNFSMLVRLPPFLSWHSHHKHISDLHKDAQFVCVFSNYWGELC